MLVKLENGRTYRAAITLSAFVRQVLPPADLVAQLARYQLFGQVAATDSGYTVTAQFRGRSGTYDLPDEVQDLVVFGN